MSETPEEFMTVADIAGVLKLNQQTVRNWIDQGRLPALRVGRRVRIRRSDFQRLIDNSYSSGDNPRPPQADQSYTAAKFWDGTKSHAGTTRPFLNYSRCGLQPAEVRP